MQKRSIDTLSLDGGWLCLDFINTIHDRTAEVSFDYLSDYGALLDWSIKVETLTREEKTELESNAAKNREQSNNISKSVKEARNTLYDFFLAIAQNNPPNPDTQFKFNNLLAKVMDQIELKVEGDLKVHQEWKSKTDLRYPLYPVIKSAYDLLTSDMLDRVKECGACGWLFLDQSKNRSRKWCSMENCGNNVKAKRYYHRKKKKNS